MDYIEIEDEIYEVDEGSVGEVEEYVKGGSSEAEGGVVEPEVVVDEAKGGRDIEKGGRKGRGEGSGGGWVSGDDDKDALSDNVKYAGYLGDLTHLPEEAQRIVREGSHKLLPKAGRYKVLSGTQKKLLKALFDGKSREEAMEIAGYSRATIEHKGSMIVDRNPVIQGALHRAMVSAGITDDYLGKRLKAGLECKKGVKMSSSHLEMVEDNQMQERFMRLVLEARGDLRGGFYKASGEDGGDGYSGRERESGSGRRKANMGEVSSGKGGNGKGGGTVLRFERLLINQED